MPEKEAVVDRLVSFLDSGIVRWCKEIDLPSLCSSNHRQLLELKVINIIIYRPCKEYKISLASSTQYSMISNIRVITWE